MLTQCFAVKELTLMHSLHRSFQLFYCLSIQLFIFQISISPHDSPAYDQHISDNHSKDSEETIHASEAYMSTSKSEYEFGKTMHEYAKRLQQKPTLRKEIPTSKSDSNIVDSKNEMNHHASGSNKGNHYWKHDHHHQQCCSGFGSGSRHRFQSNACIIV